jgi:hypothetical protein
VIEPAKYRAIDLAKSYPLQRLTFIDETAATTKMTRLCGRAPRGERLVDKVPHGRRRHARRSGSTPPRMTAAPKVTDGGFLGF